MHRFTEQQTKTMMRVHAGMARDRQSRVGVIGGATPPGTMTLADLQPYFEAEAKATLAKVKLEDEVYDLLMKEARGPKPYKSVSKEEKHALRRKAMCIADTVTRAEAL